MTATSLENSFCLPIGCLLPFDYRAYGAILAILEDR
jgi:hypothetical protein